MESNFKQDHMRHLSLLELSLLELSLLVLSLLELSLLELSLLELPLLELSLLELSLLQLSLLELSLLVLSLLELPLMVKEQCLLVKTDLTTGRPTDSKLNRPALHKYLGRIFGLPNERVEQLFVAES